MNVDFGSLCGSVLDDEEDLGDELDDVTRLKDEVAFPLAHADGRRLAGPRSLLMVRPRLLMVMKLQTAGAGQVLDACSGAIKLRRNVTAKHNKNMKKNGKMFGHVL